MYDHEIFLVISAQGLFGWLGFLIFHSWEASVRGRPHCQGFILASADPQPWTHC